MDIIFNWCASMTVLEYPDFNTTSFGVTMFASCKSLRELVIPESISSFGSGTFSTCGDIILHLRPTTPPTFTNSNALNGTIPTIYVPYSEDHSVLAAYKSANVWSTYADSIFEEPQT